TRFPNRNDRRANYYVDVIFAVPSTATPVMSPTRAPEADRGAPPSASPSPSPSPSASATPEPLPPLGRPSCVDDAIEVTTADDLRTNVAQGRDVCATADLGDVNLDDLPGDHVRHVGTSGSGALGAV